MKAPRRIRAEPEPLPYAFRRADGVLLIVCEADLATELAVDEAEQRGMQWHGESLLGVMVGQPAADA